MQGKFNRILSLFRKEGGSRVSRESMPDPFFINDLLWFGDANSERTAVARGFSIIPGERDGMDDDTQHDLIDRLRVLLAVLGNEYTIQGKLLVGSDYSDVLDQYDRDTDAIEDKHKNRWQLWNRKERHARYSEAMHAGKLRREILTVFFTRIVESAPAFTVSESSLYQHFQALAARESLAFEQVIGDALNSIFPDCQIRIMGDQEHFLHYYRFLNPGAGAVVPSSVLEGYDDSLSMQSNCLFTDLVQPPTPGVSFQLDGLNHAILAMTQLPKRMGPGMISHLTNLGFVDYEITLNLYPEKVSKVVDAIEKSANQLAGEVKTQPKKTHSLSTQHQMAVERIAELERGTVIPFRAFLAVRLWHKSSDVLVSRAGVVRNAFTSMSGAQCHWAVNAETARQLFFQTFPGWTYSSYTGYQLSTDDWTAAELLPWSASFTGRLDGAEALYDSARGGLVGLSTSVGGVPQMALILGQTGAGKSIFLTDLWAQIAHLFGYILVVDEGGSHATTVQTAGAEPIVIVAGGSVTINYLDPMGVPMTSEHFGGCVALCLQMMREGIGPNVDQSRLSVLQACLSAHLNLLFDAAWQEWARLHPVEANEVAARAYHIETHRAQMAGQGNTFLDAWMERRGFETPWMDESEVARFATNPSTRSIVRDLGLSYLSPSEVPTHSQLVELMTLTPINGYEDNPEAVAIGDRLSVWRANGPYGRLFDGVSTENLNGNVCHFELGLIPDSQEELKTVAHYLVRNFARQNIIKRPRAERKLVVFEEAMRMLQAPGGAKALREYYAQLRKFNTVCFTVFQQIAALNEADPSTRAAVIDNAKIILISAQPSPRAADEICEALDLSEASKQTLRRFALPEHQREGQKFSSFLLVMPDPRRKLVGTLRNVASAPVVYAGSSDNEIFDERQKALKQYEDVVEGILELSRK